MLPNTNTQTKDAASSAAKTDTAMKAKIPLVEILETVLAAVDAEPELPGDMPDELWAEIANNREAATRAFRESVIATKDGIRSRILMKVTLLVMRRTLSATE